MTLNRCSYPSGASMKTGFSTSLRRSYTLRTCALTSRAGTTLELRPNASATPKMAPTLESGISARALTPSLASHETAHLDAKKRNKNCERTFELRLSRNGPLEPKLSFLFLPSPFSPLSPFSPFLLFLTVSPSLLSCFPPFFPVSPLPVFPFPPLFSCFSPLPFFSVSPLPLFSVSLPSPCSPCFSPPLVLPVSPLSHAAGGLDVRVRLAFEKTFVKKGPLMDNDPWKQKIAVRNVEHVVKKTSSNDIAAKRSETVVARASGT